MFEISAASGIVEILLWVLGILLAILLGLLVATVWLVAKTVVTIVRQRDELAREEFVAEARAIGMAL